MMSFSRPAENCRQPRWTQTICKAAAAVWAVACIAFVVSPTYAQQQKPYMGWTSFDLQATTAPGYGANWLNEWQMEVQSNELRATLQPYGYTYFNIDSGWATDNDGYGRPTANPATFPDGMSWISNIIHGNGQKMGIYWVPGVGTDVYDANPPIYGTNPPIYVDSIVAQPLQTGDAFGSWHLKIDFTKPGAQQYINSIVDQFASWGVDFLKLDGVSPGSDQSLSYCDDRPDVQAYQTAIQQCGRPIWMTISWNINDGYIPFWQTWSNARRIDDDVAAYSTTLTGWSQVSKRFGDEANWAPWAGNHGYNNNYPLGAGWNDLDSMDVGNGSMDGLTNAQRQTVVSFWALECSPFYTGDDLYHLDSYGMSLLTNPSVIALDQAGNVGQQVQGGNSQIWAAPNGDGTESVGLFNLAGGNANVTVNYSSIGLSGTQKVHDLWANTDTIATNSYTASLASDASNLVKIGPPHVLSINFVGTGSSMASNSTAGVLALPNWNNASGASNSGGIPLVDSTGAGSGAWALWNASGTYAVGNSNTPGNYQMMNGYLDTYTGATSSVFVWDLPAAFTTNGYDVYVYTDGGNGSSTRVANYTIGGTSVNVTDNANTNYSGTFTQANNSAGNYVRFQNVGGAAFTLSATPVSSTDAYPRAPINGIQIVAH